MNKKIQIRMLSKSDWKDYRQIRLEALEHNSERFSPSHDEFSFPDEEWIKRLSNKNIATFGLYDADKIIGLTIIIKENTKQQPYSANLLSSYINKYYRKQGLSKLLFQVRIDWAKTQKDINTLVLGHFSDNQDSREAHRRFGFEFWKSEYHTMKDGSVKELYVYRLNLK